MSTTGSSNDKVSSTSKDSAALHESLHAYSNRDYDQCMACLHQLTSSISSKSGSTSNSITNESIIQIKYNTLLAECYKSLSSSSSSSSSSSLSLSSLCTKLEQLLHNKDNSNADDSNTNDDKLVSVGSTTSTALYSLASLYYHDQHYSLSCMILESNCYVLLN